MTQGLIHNRKFLQYSFILLLGLSAFLFFLLQNTQKDRDALEKRVDYWVEEAKNSKLGLAKILESKPEELSRAVVLAFLNVLYHEADDYAIRSLVDESTYFEVYSKEELIGYASLFVKDIECRVCKDLEVFIGVDLSGRISGVSPVLEMDDSPHANEKVSAWVKQLVGLTSEEVREVTPVVGATKTSLGLKKGVMDTLMRLSLVKRLHDE